MTDEASPWYYAKDDQQNGPVSHGQLTDLFATGALDPTTLVWRDGMSEWTAATQIDGLVPPQQSTPAQEVPSHTPSTPSLSSTEETSPYSTPAFSSEIPLAPVPTSGPQIRPWVRFWARMIDIVLISFTFGTILAFIAPTILDSLEFLLNILSLIVAMFVQAIFFAILGTTPGKALMRISVRQADGSKLTFPIALLRELRVFALGLGVGIPLVSLITQIASYTKLTSEQITSWDRSANLEVSHQVIGPLRWTLIIAILLASIALIIYGNSL